MTATSRAEKRRQQILTAAYQVFAEKGYHNTGIADIAEQLQIGHGTFYRYFRNKRDIFEQVILLVIERIRAVVADEDPAATNDILAYRAQVERIGHKLSDLFIGDQHLVQLLFYEALGIDESINQLIQRAFDTFGQFTELYFKNGVAKGFLRRDLETGITALAINTMIFEAGRRVFASPDPLQAKNQWIRAVVDLMFNGIAVQTGSPA